MPYKEVVIGLILGLVVQCLTVSAAPATEAGSVSGRAVTAEGEPASDAEATLVQLRRRVSADAEGRFEFEDVPAGDYLLEVVSLRHGRWVEAITVAAGEALEIEIALENVAHKEEILVTGSAVERSQLDVANPSNVLSGDELRARLQPSIGETLANEPGVNSTFFGPGASRPVIRGLGGDRVRMLETGIDAGDASSASPDHNVAIEPAHAERIEVLRGPATLLYGSSAIGGVVNVIDGLIPSVRSAAPIGGSVDLRGGSVNDERMGALSLEGTTGDWGWHLHGLARETDDYEIPGFAAVPDPDEDHDNEAEEGEPAEFGRVSNSDLETSSIGLGVSRFFESGFLGASISGYVSDYGVPGGEEGHDGEEEGEESAEGDEEGGIRIDMERLRFDLHSEIFRPLGPFQGLKARFGIVDYEHDEIEPSGEVGTMFFNDAYEVRLELVQRARERHSGSVGLQIRNRELESIGEEAFIPPNDSLNLALFTFQELSRGNLSYQFGARIEIQENDTIAGLPSRSFDGLSASFGLVWDASEVWSVAVSLARSIKFPNGEELYSEGPHFATQAFEIGNPSLGEEASLGLDLSLRKVSGRFTGDLTLFKTDFSDYIFQEFTGDEEDGLPVLVYSQSDAEFEGVEVQAQVGLWQESHQHLGLDLFGDLVRAELSDGSNLPRIPPWRLGTGLHYRSDRWNGRVEVIDVARQDRVSPTETPTPGYTMVNASVGYRFFTAKTIYDLMLRGRNLTDEDARNHVSFLKDRVPLPGRDISLSVRVSF